MIFSNGWSIIVGASARSLPSSRIANTGCPARAQSFQDENQGTSLELRRRERWACSTTVVPFPSVGTMSPSFSDRALLARFIKIEMVFLPFRVDAQKSVKDLFCQKIENCHVPPILSRRLSGGGHATKESNRLVGTELAVQSLSRIRDNPRMVLSIGPSLVAFPPCHWATDCILGGENRRTQGPGSPCTALQGTSLSATCTPFNLSFPPF